MRPIHDTWVLRARQDVEAHLPGCEVLVRCPGEYAGSFAWAQYQPTVREETRMQHARVGERVNVDRP